MFLCHRIPYPPDKGEKIRAFHILRHLSKCHRVHLGAFVDDASDLQHEAALRRYVKGECCLVPLNKMVSGARMLGALVAGAPLTTSYFASTRLRRWVNHMLPRVDRVVVFSSAMAPFVMGRIAPDRALLDMVDVDSDKWRQYANAVRGPKAWLYGREARTLLTLERDAAVHFSATLLVSPFEADTFRAFAPESRRHIFSMANGVDLERYSPKQSFPAPYGGDEIPLAMVGTMDYRPNVEGALWFAEQIFPLIRRTLPKAKFYIVGAKPAPELLKPREGVVVTGRVEDVRPYIAHASSVVAPLRLARGVQNKVLEGLALQKPVVATTPASRGLSVIAGRDLWVADSAAEFAEAVIAAATGPDRARIASNGRHLVERHYSWDTNLALLDELLAPESDSLEATL
nr:TIGR03087 family PEP-CTERM/XrtA system glycosyltransferase [Rhizomicrobium palustre]